MWDPEAAGIDGKALGRFIQEHVYSLPGVDAPQEALTILITGSRSAGIHTETSDVDIDVLCPQDVYESVQRESFKAGIVKGRRSFFFVLRDDDWRRYFGKRMGRPHFSLTGLDRVEEHFRDCTDPFLWIWSNAGVVSDPGGRFQRIRESFSGYPKDLLVRKIKYHWLLAGYWEVDVYPHHHCRDDEVLPASTAVLSAVNELLRVFFLVEGRPFPYAEKLMRLAPTTRLGRRFGPMLQRVVDMVVARTGAAPNVWDRLDKAMETLCAYDKSAECRLLDDACAQAMIAAGVDPEWVEADYGNIHELLLGDLGPVP